jgi:hypothetical protein
MGKSRITRNAFDSVNWTRLGQAIKKMTVPCRLFCSKHMSGMCGVGKFQKLWNTKASDACPHCRNSEDALHVQKCQSETVSETWSNSLKTLESSLNKLDTDPDLINAIIMYLNAWRYDYNLHSLEESKIRSLLELQETIGTRQIFEGWLHKEWENRQEHYYRTSNSKRNNKTVGHSLGSMGPSQQSIP